MIPPITNKEDKEKVSPIQKMCRPTLLLSRKTFNSLQVKELLTRKRNKRTPKELSCSSFSICTTYRTATTQALIVAPWTTQAKWKITPQLNMATLPQNRQNKAPGQHLSSNRTCKIRWFALSLYLRHI